MIDNTQNIELIYNCITPDGIDVLNIHETFNGTQSELFAHLERMSKEGCYNISIKQT